MEFSFDGELWEHDGEGGWHFVTLPVEVADDIREHSGPGRGFGSVRVTVVLGSSEWRTSLFPETKTGSFVLPVKQQVRRANDVAAGDRVHVRLTLA